MSNQNATQSVNPPPDRNDMGKTVDIQRFRDVHVKSGSKVGDQRDDLPVDREGFIDRHFRPRRVER